MPNETEKPIKLCPPEECEKIPLSVKMWVTSAFLVLSLIIISIAAWILVMVPRMPLPRLVWEGQGETPICRQSPEPKKKIRVLATAYSSTLDQTDDTPCLTATGYDVCENYARYGAANTIASNFLPLHAIVKIPEFFGDQIFVVRDRMNDRYYNRLDLWMPTRTQAVRFGVRYVTVEVY